MIKIIGIGEMAASANRGDVLKTFALSSCVAVTAYSPRKKVSGLVHIALPTADGVVRVHVNPCYYADTGVPLLIESMRGLCACKAAELRIRLYGGASSVTVNDVFHVGRMNLLETRRILSAMHLSYQEKDTGGHLSRTLEMNVETGEVLVYSQPLIL